MAKKKKEEVAEVVLEESTDMLMAVADAYNIIHQDDDLAKLWDEAKDITVLENMARAVIETRATISDPELLHDAVVEFMTTSSAEKLDDDWKKIVAIYEENVREDHEHIATIAGTANRNIQERFCFSMLSKDSPERNGYKIIPVTFIIIFNTITDFLKSKREKHRNYEIEIAGRVKIGYSNQINEEDLKTGNFMIYIKDMDHYEIPNMDMDFKTEEHVKEYVTAWNQENMIRQPEDTREIAATALKRLGKEAEIHLGSAEMVFPVFITIYDTLVKYMMTYRKEIHEEMFELNFCNCFTITSMEQDSGIDKITIRGSVGKKMALKSDGIITSQFE